MVHDHGRVQAPHHAGGVARDADLLVDLEAGFGFAPRATTAATARLRGLRHLGTAVDRCRSRHRRLVAGGPRYASGWRGAGLGRLFRARGAHRAGLFALVGFELFGGRFGLRKIYLGADGGAQVVVADHRLQQLHHALQVRGLDIAQVLHLLGIEPLRRMVFSLRREQRASAIEHAHRLGIQFGHARRHQVHDAVDLRALQRAAGVQVEHHRRRWFLLLAKEAVLVRQRQVHTCRLHRGDLLDGACELAFKRTLQVDALLALGLAEGRFVEQLVAGDRTLGQAGGAELHAQVVHLRGGHHDRAAAFGKAVGHVHLRELFDDAAAVTLAKVGKQQLVFPLAAAQGKGHQHRDQRCGADAGQQPGAGRHGGPAGTQALRSWHQGYRVCVGDGVVHESGKITSRRRLQGRHAHHRGHVVRGHCSVPAPGAVG